MTNKAIDASILETLDYYDTEFRLEKYPDRESWPVSDHAGGLTVGQLRSLQSAQAPDVAEALDDLKTLETIIVELKEAFDFKMEYYAKAGRAQTVGSNFSLELIDKIRSALQAQRVPEKITAAYIMLYEHAQACEILGFDKADELERVYNTIKKSSAKITTAQEKSL